MPTLYGVGYKTRSGWVTVKGYSYDDAFATAKRGAISYWSNDAVMKRNPRTLEVVVNAINKATLSSPGRYLKKYKEGGIATHTGLAWLDGTKSRPERILNPYQTQLFEDMISTLHTIRRVNISNMSRVAPKMESSGMVPNIESIVVNVERMDDASDIERVVEDMAKQFYQRISRGRTVGGIQGW